MKLTDTTPVCRVQIGKLYQRPPAQVTPEGAALQATLLGGGQGYMHKPRKLFEPLDPPWYVKLGWALALPAGMAALYGLGWLLVQGYLF